MALRPGLRAPNARKLTHAPATTSNTSSGRPSGPLRARRTPARRMVPAPNQRVGPGFVTAAVNIANWIGT